MPADIPDHVRRFISEHVDSVSLLDVLLLLRAAGDKPWTAEETARALVSSEPVTSGHLDRLARDGLARRDAEGYRYAPGPRAAVIEELAECYARRRHTVIGMIYGPDVRQASELADAFRIRRRK